ncbi:glycosyltransferase [Polaribacter sp.]|nr:glycosyltransferase [Polaribacter sp.]
MKKNKILFHYSMLNVGGAERSVVQLINMLVQHNWDVSLVLNVAGGTLENKLDSNVEIIHFFPKPWKNKIVSQQTILKKIGYLFLYLVPILFYTLMTFFKKVSFRFKKYDAAVISLQGLNPSFVCNYVKANKKFLYLRNDLSRSKKKEISENIKKFNHLLDGYLCVSTTVLESLDSINPSFKEKAHVLYNIVNIDEIILLSKEIEDPYKTFREEDCPILVTVCRMSDVSKGIFRQLEAAEILKNEGLRFKWFFLGDGADLLGLKAKIKKKGMEEFIIPLGEKGNPYPYIKHCDIACVLSNYEGLSGVVNESKFLGKTLIATEVSGIREQITHLQNGFVVENNLEGIVMGLRKLITNKELRLTLENNFLGSNIADNPIKLEKLEKLIKA